MTDLEAARAIAARLREALKATRTTGLCADCRKAHHFELDEVGGRGYDPTNHHPRCLVNPALSESQPIAEWMAERDHAMRLEGDTFAVAQFIALLADPDTSEFRPAEMKAAIEQRDSRVRDAALEEAAEAVYRAVGVGVACEAIQDIIKLETLPTARPGEIVHATYTTDNGGSYRTKCSTAGPRDLVTLRAEDVNCPACLAETLPTVTVCRVCALWTDGAKSMCSACGGKGTR